MRSRQSTRRYGAIRRRRKLAGLLVAGMCFQSASCALDSSQLVPNLVTTIASLFITDYINNLFGVSPSPF